jgi:hypothetical protein
MPQESTKSGTHDAMKKPINERENLLTPVWGGS